MRHWRQAVGRDVSLISLMKVDDVFALLMLLLMALILVLKEMDAALHQERGQAFFESVKGGPSLEDEQKRKSVEDFFWRREQQLFLSLD